MTNAYRYRFLYLVAALAVMAALSLWAIQRSWFGFNSLERRLTAAHLESFRLADECQRRLLTLNNSMLRFTVRREPAIWSEFEQASRELGAWIDEQAPKLNTDREREVFRQLDAGFESYLQAAHQAHNGQTNVDVSAGALTQIMEFEDQAAHLLALSQLLGEAHRQAREAFLGQANVQLGHLRILLFAAVGLSLPLMAGLGWFVYRDLIGPLRTRLVQSEDLLERQEKLVTLGTLAAGIAHEIRNPLTSIKARLYTLGKHIKGNPAGLTDTVVISDEIARLERIVQDVLSFARPSEPKRVAVRADVPLIEVHSLMAGPLQNSGVHLVLEPAQTIYVSIDVALIKQVLINLVRNAAEAIEGGGTVTLRVRTDRITLQGKERSAAILEVVDTGKGMPPEIQKRLFDPFFTTKEAGTGLGLSIAMRIVEKNGGLLQYHTQMGRGTTFGIILPAVAPEPRDASSAQQKT